MYNFQRLAWLGVLIVGVIAYLLVLQTLIATQNLNFFPSLLLIGAGTGGFSPERVLNIMESEAQQAEYAGEILFVMFRPAA